MLKAVKYCQKQLGGKILDKSGQPLREAKEKKNLREFLDKMKSRGIVPGSEKALLTF